MYNIDFAEYTSAQERIALGKKSKKKEANKRREQMKEMIVDMAEDEEDEDAAEWAQEQARRGGQFSDEVVPRTSAKQTYKPSPSMFYSVSLGK
jgi:GC-rich sequence DNA-binding factor